MSRAARTTSDGALAPSEAVEWVWRSTSASTLWSARVVRLGRCETRLRLGPEALQVSVAQLRERLFARARALRGVTGHSDHAIGARTRNEHEGKFIAIVLCHTTRRENAPGLPVGDN